MCTLRVLLAGCAGYSRAIARYSALRGYWRYALQRQNPRAAGEACE